MTAIAPFPAPTKVWRNNTYPSIDPSRPELSAEGKNILITGGGSGIGAETAHRFAQAGAARIALLGRREQPLLDTKTSIQAQYPHVDVFTAITDVTKRDQVQKAFQDFIDNGKIDVLVSNAAMTGPMDSVKDVDPEKFMYGVDTNIRGALNVAQAFLDRAADDAVIIETSTSAVHVNFGAGFASYTVAKLGMFRLWDSVCFANPKFRVYHVQPGVVDTAMNREAGGIDAVGSADDGESAFSGELL